MGGIYIVVAKVTHNCFGIKRLSADVGIDVHVCVIVGGLNEYSVIVPGIDSDVLSVPLAHVTCVLCIATHDTNTKFTRTHVYMHTRTTYTCPEQQNQHVFSV